MSATTHFTAVVEIHKTTTTPGRTDYGKTTPDSREVAEVAKLVIRAATIESLRDKIAAHAALIEEAN
ncbi:hypothetical protein SEA_WARDA_53 [Arthrobacter phage Warda]|uniref:Uncharacterized protein n=1 Tax=Arthrobacter phage Warda TaxID=2832322 RepID=A0AA48Y3G8_9CAUD|nr:hypothetical protein PQE11_gp53 [Arthrobacter phage Warda]UIW13235.1 hypothetical protein SEA_WARDA_53 [Arthrobacter phage Warda]